MFSIFKQASNEDVVLQELSEGQLTEVAGGYGHSWKNEHHKHHHHHSHNHHMSHHKWMPKKKPSSHAPSMVKHTMHW